MHNTNHIHLFILTVLLMHCQITKAQEDRNTSIVSSTEEGIGFIMEGSPEKAIPCFTKAIQKDSLFWELYFLNALAHVWNEQVREAVIYFEKSIPIKLSATKLFPDTSVTNSILNRPPFDLDHGISMQSWQHDLIKGTWEYIVSNGKNKSAACKLWQYVNNEKPGSINNLINLYCK